MMKQTHIRAMIAALAAAALFACSHQATPVRTLQVQLTPFEQNRAQAIALVTTGKRVLDPMGINRLDVAYTDVEEKANAYSGFLVESLDVGGLDAQKNAEYAASLKNAIDNFNRSYTALRASAPAPGQPVTTLSSAWVSPFAKSVQNDWDRYRSALASAPADQKAAVADTIRHKAVWPNFEDIATEKITLPPQVVRVH